MRRAHQGRFSTRFRPPSSVADAQVILDDKEVTHEIEEQIKEVVEPPPSVIDDGDDDDSQGDDDDDDDDILGDDDDDNIQGDDDDDDGNQCPFILLAFILCK